MNNKKREKIAKIFAITVVVIMMFQVLIPLFTSSFITDLQTNSVNNTSTNNLNIDDLKNTTEVEKVTDNVVIKDNAESLNSDITIDNQ